MKKVTAALLFAALAATMSFGQINFKNGENVGTAGIGFGMAGIYGDAGLPPLSITLDHAINDQWSVGGLLGYAGSSYNFAGASIDYSYIAIAARGAYHFDAFHNKDIDTYGGAMLGYNIVSVSGSGVGYVAGGSYLNWGLFLGGRYYFNPKLSATAELGYGINVLRLAVGYKL